MRCAQWASPGPPHVLWLHTELWSLHNPDQRFRTILMSSCTPAVEHRSSFPSGVLQRHCQDFTHLSGARSTLAAHDNGLQWDFAAGLSLSKHAVGYTVCATLKQAWMRVHKLSTRCEWIAQV